MNPYEGGEEFANPAITPGKPGAEEAKKAEAGGQMAGQAALTPELAGMMGTETAGMMGAMNPLAQGFPLTPELAAQTGQATMGAGMGGAPAMAPQGAQNFFSRGLQNQHPGWSMENFNKNLGDMNFAGNAPSWAPMATGIGGLGMANYWSEDAAAEEEAKRQEETDADNRQTQDRYNYYSDLARRVNAGELTAPTFLPPYTR
jgi:hypothetical protein